MYMPFVYLLIISITNSIISSYPITHYLLLISQIMVFHYIIHFNLYYFILCFISIIH